MALEKIISGGQTGVDRGVLNVALSHGFPCGGWYLPGRRAEDGVILPEYPVTELTEGGYRQRMIQPLVEKNTTTANSYG
ncbi:conserved hypothetical protein (plasmid) [Nitrosococcus halophilus Nc 4]|uniref:Molybdenum cofactor carrier n=1 Tax=Nitrosococcus halophilus (strain Nc4) TaxID=472759 RepID=D5C5H9_NITHN|nr:putative molybdenum carrier protein [Nitrosococcus halophilus]ADE17033.1 conserved hypothetical protein [Nitrosococcus halophilus Nc 4]